jgi:hypothetical protein
LDLFAIRLDLAPDLRLRALAGLVAAWIRLRGWPAPTPGREDSAPSPRLPVMPA